MPTVNPADALIDNLRFGATLVVTQLTVYQNGIPTEYVVPVSTMDITVDRNAAQRRSGSITAEITPTAPPPALLPTGPSSALSPFGNEVFIQTGIAAQQGVLYAAAPLGATSVEVYNPEQIVVGSMISFPGDGAQYSVTAVRGSNTPFTLQLGTPLLVAEAAGTPVNHNPQWVPIGLFEIATTTVDDTSLDLVTTLQVYDRSWVISQRQFIQAYIFPMTASGNFVDEMVFLLNFVWGTNQATGTPIPESPPLNFNIVPTSLSVPAATYDQGSDPWQAAMDMAECVGYELYFDVYGNVVGHPIPNPFNRPVTWNFTDQPDNIYGTGGSGSGGGSSTLLGSVYSTPTAVQNSMTRDGIYNDVYITGVGTSNAPYSTTGSDAPVLAEAADVSPATTSPTSIYGPMGDIPEFVSSNLVSSGGQALQMAKSELLLTLSASWTITLTIAPNPIFDIDDVVTVTHARVGLANVPMVIDTIDYAVSYGDLCTITGRVLQAGTQTGTVAWKAYQDGGPNNQGLQLYGIVDSVASPGGSAFNQAAQSVYTGSYLQGPYGTSNAQGAATGSAFSAEAIIEWPFIEPTLPITGVALTRVEPGGNQWSIGLSANTAFIEYKWTDSTGTVNTFTGTNTIAPLTAYWVQLAWDGSTLYGFVNGVLDLSTAMTSVMTPSANGALRIIGSSAMGDITVDEVRISDVARNTSGYTPASAPFTSDGSTGALYHLDAGFITETI
jgi:Concanavalin A-like lectin/glucanases superfamily